MKSLDELLAYYRGSQMGRWATSELLLDSMNANIWSGDDSSFLDASLLCDADLLSRASLASLLACSRLRTGGHFSWGEISLYYAQFQSVSAMARLIGIAPLGKWILIRTDERLREYKRIRTTTPEAKKVGCGGGAHEEIWRIFSRHFSDWTEGEAPQQTAYCLSEEHIFVGNTAYFQIPAMERNEVNYLRSNSGFFFPETTSHGILTNRAGETKQLGNWNWLRTDASLYGSQYSPEEIFFKEMMTWDLIKYTIAALVRSQRQELLKDYIGIIDNLEAYSELAEYLKSDLSAACNSD